MKPTTHLSIIAASHNDCEQTALTIASIVETTPMAEVEIIVVDDCSATPLIHYVQQNDFTRLIVNRQRCGCGPSRHIGALHARGTWLLIVDSHVRFRSDWYQNWCAIRDAYPAGTLFCATCLGLDSNHMDVNNPVSEYHGATLVLHGPDRNKKGAEQAFEAVWLPREPELKDGDELPAIMGACYFCTRESFLRLAPTRFLRTWGCDEQSMSVKYWLSGAEIRMARSVKIGHKFLVDGQEKQAWGVPPGHVLWNKLFCINTLFPVDIAERVIASLLAVHGKETHDVDAAKKLYVADYHLVAAERALNAQLFTRDVHWYLDRFGIAVP